MKIQEKKLIKQGVAVEHPANTTPAWKKITIESNVPGKLNALKDISKNMWWAWDDAARELFNEIEPSVWEDCEHNPILLLERTSLKRFQELKLNEAFIMKMISVRDRFHQYMRERERLQGPAITYFSMEYGIHSILKTYSGGLGVLAGDYMKEASDSKVNMTAMGLLYRYGYFKQIVSRYGEQTAQYEAEDFSKIPVQPVVDENGQWLSVNIEMNNRVVVVNLWKVYVGSIKLYLLDTDHDANQKQDRSITHHLYGGDNENRIKQEMILGLGGIRALKKLGVKTDIYHCNEGHAAFIGLERIKYLHEEENLTFAEAKEVVRSTTLFTTHTPVPAGHDLFHDDLFLQYMGNFNEKISISKDEFMMLGKASKHEDHFNMSYLASNLSQKINGVSRLHGDVSRRLLSALYKGFLPEELNNIGYVTNGVHFSTWAAKEWKNLHKKYLHTNDLPSSIHQYNKGDYNHAWENIYKVPDTEIWKIKAALKVRMIKYIKEHFSSSQIQRNEHPKFISKALSKLNPKALTVGFARRFATYKRATLLFHDLKRLASIVNNPERPIQFIFAGKAHPADKEGQKLIKYIIETSKKPEFLGKILFIQNYDMELAKMLIQGCDIWLNTPTRPLEASGTSGEKGVMNGTLNLSIRDGWWEEGYQEGAGWGLTPKESFSEQNLQNEFDAETIYNILENDALPKYYSKKKKDAPSGWVGLIKNNFAKVAPNFTTKRMLKDYFEKFYTPMAEHSAKLKTDNFKAARELSAWKEHIAKLWEQIEVVSVQPTDGVANVTYKMGQSYVARVALDLKELSPHEIGVEILVATDSGNPKLVQHKEFNCEKAKSGLVHYTVDLKLKQPGTYKYSMRIFPKNKLLLHRQDFKYMRWIE